MTSSGGHVDYQTHAMDLHQNVIPGGGLDGSLSKEHPKAIIPVGQTGAGMRSPAPSILAVVCAVILSGCAHGTAQTSNLQKSHNAGNPGPMTPVVEQTKAGRLLSGVMELLKRKDSIRELDIGALSVALGKEARTFAPGHFGYREAISSEWSYMVDVRHAAEKQARLDVNFISTSAGGTASATELCELDFERMAAELRLAGYRQETNHGEHGGVVYEQFHRPDATVTISTIGEASTPPEKVTHRCIQILTAQ